MHDDIMEEERYVRYMINSLKKIVGRCIFIKYTNNYDTFQNIKEIINYSDKFDGTIGISSNLFGPFCDIMDKIKKFELSEKRILVNSFSSLFDGKDDNKIPDFFILKENVVLSFSNLSKDYIDELVETGNDFYKINKEIYEPYSLLKMGYPFLNIKCFQAPSMLKFSMQEELSRAYAYIEIETLYDTGMIWEIILKIYNIYDIKRAMHLDYIISVNELKTASEGIRNDVAVFIHLYYEDLFEYSIDYIKKIPSYIDIYISTTEDKIDSLKHRIHSEKIKVKEFRIAGERGRDAGALLVAFRPYAMRYQYIGFIHDKKTSGGLEADSVGNSFRQLMWESLLNGREYIEEIISLFDKEKKLGFLSPPIPLVGIYVSKLLGAEWTICYDETLKLAKMLGCKLKMDREKPVFALSTSFWCRTDALRPLFEYPWKYSDFPSEPIKLDGMINHAIERILIYIAQYQGYYSATVTTQEYASAYMSNMMYILDTVFGEIHKSNWMQAEFPLKLDNTIPDLCRLIAFCQTHSNIILYGAGAQAKLLMKKLQNLDIKVNRIAVTRKSEDERFMGYFVEEFGEMNDIVNKDYGIIVAMSKKFQVEVIQSIEDTGIDYFLIHAEE